MTNKIIKLKTFNSPELEQLSEIEQLPLSGIGVLDKESISVFQEVRKELAGAYTENKELTASYEQLSKDFKTLKKEQDESGKTIETLSNELKIYKTREEEASKTAYNKRLEQLSINFNELGQVKTVEHLSKLPANVIDEFESITSMALKKKTQETLSGVTIPTQGMSTPKPVEIPVASAKPEDFIKGIAKTLQGQQNVDGSESKRIKFM